MADLASQRKRLEAEIARSRPGSARAKEFDAKLQAVRGQVQAQRRAAGKPLKRAPINPVATIQPTQNPAPPQMSPGLQAPPKGVVGDNFKLGTTDERLAEQLNRAQSEIQRRGGVAPNNTARLEAIKAEQARRAGGMPPGAQTPAMSPPLTAGPGVGNPATGQPNTPQTGGPLTPAQPPGMQPPSSFNPNMPSNPEGMAGNIYNQATGGTISQFDTAANRLRERLDVQAQGMKDQATSRNVGRGFGVSGAQDADMYNVNQGQQQAYGQGLVDLSDKFEGYRQQGLQTGLGATNSIMQNRQFGDQLSTGLLNNREGRASAEKISGNELASRERLQREGFKFEGSENDANRQLQELLGQLGEQGSNWRASLSSLFNIPGLFSGGSGGLDLSGNSSSGSSSSTNFGYNLGSNLGFTSARR